jgi:Rrf2 family transcriptional regulator, iron-sulfur cluster assembly transcription factor
LKVLSNPTVYAIRALVYIASQPPGQYVNLREISDRLDISFHFLTKTFQQLNRHGLVRSYRGPGGGVMLAQPPSRILLTQIVYAIEGDDFFGSCILGLPGCGSEEPCPVHGLWAGIRKDLQQRFSETNLESLRDLQGRIGLIQ